MEPRDYLRALTAAIVLLGAGRIALAARPTATNERAWGRRTRRLLGIDLDVRGLEHIDPDQQYVVAPLHEGFADIPALLSLPLDLRFVARDELAGWRLLGPHLVRAGHPIIEPERPRASYRALLSSASRVFDQRASLVTFPQGTLLGIETAFAPGAFRIADRMGRPVLPIVLTGSHRVWEHPFSPRLRFGCRIDMRVLEPLAPGGAVDAMSRVERRMKEIALQNPAPPRRFVPARDGWWDGYAYSIDPAFGDLADEVARHRVNLAPNGV